jgi:hypothetical protein
MDTQVGKALAGLEKAGLAEDTIVIFNSDHGGVLPRSKRFLFDSGLHVPFVVRIPEKFKHLWPAAKPGTTVDRLVSFVDLPKTWLSLTDSEVPKVMQGRIMLGPKTEAEPAHVFSFRERMDERFDNQRAVRDKRYVYIKNYMPYVPWGQHLDYLWKMVATRTWEDAFKNKRTNEVTGRFFMPKPAEELYDMQADPDNVANLADKPEHRQTLEKMRAALREWQLAIHDTGLLPEAERERRANENNTTIYQMVRDPKLYDLPAYLDAADLALAKDSTNAPRLVEMLASKDSGIRFWGAVGLLSLGKADAKAQTALEGVLQDDCGDVGAMAAWALIQSGKPGKAQPALAAVIQKHAGATLLALNVLDWAHVEITPYVAALDALYSGKTKATEYENRMSEYLRESHGLKIPESTEGVKKSKRDKAVKADL